MGYTMYADDVLFYRSEIDEEEYQALDIKLDEELNRSASLSFILLPTNVCYDSLHQLKTVIRLVSDTRELFRGRVVNYETDIFGQRTVKCEDALAYLLDSIFYTVKGVNNAYDKTMTADNAAENEQSPSGLETVLNVADSVFNGDYSGAASTAWGSISNSLSSMWTTGKEFVSGAADYIKNNGFTPSGFFNDVVSPYISGDMAAKSGTGSNKTTVEKETARNFFTRVLICHCLQVDEFKRIYPGNFTALTEEEDEPKVYGSDSVSDTRSVLDSALQKQYGGYFRIRYGDDGLCYLDYLKEYGTENHQIIQLGVNLEEINYKEDTEKVFTVLMPLGKNQGTIAKVNNGSVFLEAPEEYIQRFGRIVKAKEWSDLTDANDVLTEAQKYMEKCCSMIPVKMDVTAIDLHLLDSTIDEIQLGDTVNVYVPSRGINENKMVLKISRDLQAPENTTYTIGDEDVEDENSTTSYRSNKFGLSQLLAEIDGNTVKREALTFDIDQAFKVDASDIRLVASSDKNIRAYAKGGTEYQVGDVVRFGDRVYKCTSIPKDEDGNPLPMTDDSPAGSKYWTQTDLQPGHLLLSSDITEMHSNLVSIYAALDAYGTNQLNAELAVENIRRGIAKDYDTPESAYEYQKGDWTWHDGKLYIAKNNGLNSSQPFSLDNWAEPDPTTGYVGINGTLYVAKSEVGYLIAQELEAQKATIANLVVNEMNASSASVQTLDANSITVGGVPLISYIWSVIDSTKRSAVSEATDNAHRKIVSLLIDRGILTY